MRTVSGSGPDFCDGSRRALPLAIGMLPGGSPRSIAAPTCKRIDTPRQHRDQEQVQLVGPDAEALLRPVGILPCIVATTP